MKRDELRRLCDWYRSVGVEVIPLVQSFGHVKWLTRSNANLDIMLNRKVPFAVDPRNPKVTALYSKLWKEVIDVTKAKTIHVGLDEVDFRGFPPTPGLLTKLWNIQVPMLAAIAKENRVKLMLWGDELLSPGEGASPHTAKTVDEARARRAVVPKGSFICDWHYQKSTDPKLYADSLALFKREGFKVIGAAWNEPENIRGMNVACVKQSAGTLQTTWSGFESNEKVMLKNIDQFAAMVIAADTSWQGRTSSTKKPKYDPKAFFLRLYNDR